MKFLTTLLAICLVFGFSANAQKDPKARQILDAMSAKYKKTPSFKADFKYIMENPEEDINEGFKGKILVKGDMYKLLMEGQEIRFDGQNIWTYSKELDEVQVSPNDPDDEEISISNIFDIYKSGYKYLYLEAQDGGKTEVIDLVPDDQDLSYYKIRMRIEASTKSLKSFKVFDKSGSRYLYEVVTFAPETGLVDSNFTFSDSELKGKELIDFR